MPYDSPRARPDAWEVREKMVEEYGVPDFMEKVREVVKPAPLFDKEDWQ